VAVVLVTLVWYLHVLGFQQPRLLDEEVVQRVEL
jgi:hypothetical protein